MPSFRTAFQSKYLKAEDLGSTRPIVTIASVTLEDFGSGADVDRKLVAHFKNQLKPLVLNKINSESIAEIAGTDDYDAWAGVKIQLFATRTEFQGKRVPCIRVCAPPPPRRGAPSGSTSASTPDDGEGPDGRDTSC